jgi:hypothetical protein
MLTAMSRTMYSTKTLVLLARSTEPACPDAAAE